MRNKWIKPLIGIVILILIMVAYFMLSNKQEDEITEDETIKLIDVDKNTVSEVTIVNTNEQDTIKLVRNDDNTWAMANNPDFSLDESIVSSLTSNISSLDAYRLVEENSVDLSVYGLVNPLATISLLLDDGKVINVTIGDKSSVGDYYYATCDVPSNVYLIYGWAAESFLSSTSYLRDKQVSFIDSTELSSILITRPDIDDLEIRKKEEGDNSVSYGMGDYIITKSYDVPKPASTDAVVQKVLRPLDALKIKEFVNDRQTDVDYSVYGLDVPVMQILASDTAGNILSLVFGSDTDDGAIYFKHALEPNVFSMDKSLVEGLLTITPFDLVDRFLSLFKMDDIKEVTITSGDTVRSTSVIDGDDGTQTFILDDNVITEEIFRTVLNKVSGVLYDSQLPDDAEITGSAVITFVYDLKSSSENVKVEFYDYNNDFYAAGVNGQILYAVSKKTVNNIVQDINLL